MGMATVQLITFSVAEIINVAELGCIGTGLNFLSIHTDIIIRTQLLDKSEILQFSLYLLLHVQVFSWIWCEEQCSSLIWHLIPLQESNNN